MKISCDSCGAKYTVSDDKVQGKTVKVKCRKCSAVIVVSSSGQVTTTAGQSSSPGATPSTAGSYTVAVADGDQRNMTAAEIVEAYNNGIIDADTFLWAEGMDDWQPLREVDAIVDALHAAAGQSEAVSAADASSQQEDLGATVAMTDGAAAFAAAPAPAAGRGYGAAPAPAAGGYGSASASAASGSGRGAGSAPAYASSPVFGSGGASAPRAGASQGGMFPAAAATAARASSPLGVGGNLGAKPAEDSAIFSLNMLTAKVGAEGAAAPAPNFSEEEDSGLIDLKALAAGLSTDAVLSSPLDVTGGIGGVFPLGAPPPVAAPIKLEEETKQGVSKMLIAILATAVLGLGAAVVFLIVRGGGTPPAPTVIYSAAPPVSASPTIATTTEEVASAEPSGSASASGSAKVAGKGVGKVGPKGTSGGATTGSPPSTGATSPPKASCGCGCGSDDLMCCMRCSQKKGK